MSRRFLLRAAATLVTVAGLYGSCCAPAAAQDMPLLRSLIEGVVVAELSSHDSQDNAWYNERSKDKQKWMKSNLFGRQSKVKLASWTEESKSWVWLEDPHETLSVDLKQLALNDGRIEFAVAARAKARFKVWGRIPKLTKGMAGGTVWLEIEIAGSAAIANGRLADSKITTLHGTFGDLQFNNDLASVFEDLVEDSLNAHLKRDNEKLREKLERSINKVGQK